MLMNISFLSRDRPHVNNFGQVGRMYFISNTTLFIHQRCFWQFSFFWIFYKLRTWLSFFIAQFPLTLRLITLFLWFIPILFVAIGAHSVILNGLGTVSCVFPPRKDLFCLVFYYSRSWWLTVYTYQAQAPNRSIVLLARGSFLAICFAKLCVSL